MVLPKLNAVVIAFLCNC